MSYLEDLMQRSKADVQAIIRCDDTGDMGVVDCRGVVLVSEANSELLQNSYSV